MAIKSSWSPLLVGLMEFFTGPMRRRWMPRLCVRLSASEEELGAAERVLMVSNHVGWWDGFVLRAVQRRLWPSRPHFYFMSQAGMARRPLFRRMGAIAVDPANGALNMAAFREMQHHAAAQPQAVFTIFAQGSIWPNHRRPLGFLRGLNLAVRLLKPLTLLPVMIHYEPLDLRQGYAFVDLLTPQQLGPEDRTPDWHVAMEAQITASHDALASQLASTGEATPKTWGHRWQG